MLIIDRFEGEFAVVENTDTEEMLLIKKELIDNDVRESDVIVLLEEKYHTDIEATKKRRADVLALLKKIDPNQR